VKAEREGSYQAAPEKTNSIDRVDGFVAHSKSPASGRADMNIGNIEFRLLGKKGQHPSRLSTAIFFIRGILNLLCTCPSRQKSRLLCGYS
jgi:hypothetical protein